MFRQRDNSSEIYSRWPTIFNSCFFADNKINKEAKEDIEAKPEGFSGECVNEMEELELGETIIVNRRVRRPL